MPPVSASICKQVVQSGLKNGHGLSLNGRGSGADVKRCGIGGTMTLSMRIGEAVLAAGSPAVTGRVVGSRYLNAAIAENFFTKALRAALPYAYPTPTKEQA